MPIWPKRKPRPIVDEYGRAPHWYLAANGELKGVSKAVAKGADPSQPDDTGLTPLHVAAQNGHVEMVELLLRLGANPNSCDKHGNGPLWKVTLRPQISLPKRVAIISLLLKAGADPHRQNAAGTSPGQVAREIGHGLELPFLQHNANAV